MIAGQEEPFREVIRVTLRHVCPACLRGPLFRHGYAMHAHCPTCGQDLTGSDGAQYGGPMVFGYTIGGASGVVTALLLILLFGLSTWTVWAAILVTVLSVLLTWRHCRAAWTWLLYRTGQLQGPDSSAGLPPENRAGR